MEPRSPRLLHGTLYRFDSATELVTFCRTRYPKAEVWSGSRGGEFVLRVRGAEVDFESLIVHFEGERTYAVMLAPGPEAAESDRSTPLE